MGVTLITNEVKHDAISDHLKCAKKSMNDDHKYTIDHVVCHAGKARISDMSYNGIAILKLMTTLSREPTIQHISWKGIGGKRHKQNARSDKYKINAITQRKKGQHEDAIGPTREF